MSEHLDLLLKGSGHPHHQLNKGIIGNDNSNVTSQLDQEGRKTCIGTIPNKIYLGTHTLIQKFKTKII
jgi:hypothetical protein